MPERAQRVGRVVVARQIVDLAAEELCRPGWVRYAVPVPDHVVAYRVGESWGLPLRHRRARRRRSQRRLRHQLLRSGRGVDEGARVVIGPQMD